MSDSPDYGEFRAAMRKTIAHPMKDAIVPGLSSNPHTARRQLDACDLRKRMTPEMKEADARLISDFIEGLFGPVND